ncbi:enoyl-CoA hydratase domain-containing protein 3, mitochondrial isoform X2 [Agrilus planipennis]|nr:enoyl-CoA hydratase domain-containing protein 3, mitochondrial isoform X2 [Agrilus planipennis]
MMETLIKEITADQDFSNLRAIVISAEGPVFSAGHNLKELKSELGKAQYEKVFSLATKLMLSIINSPVPIIAKVDGLAAAAGCQLIAQCDITICSEESQFSTPGANFGIFCSTPGIALARCVPKMVALHMLLTGNPISSKEAKESGLVSKVVSKDKLDEEVDKICNAILLKSRSVIELGKKFYYKQVQTDIKNAYAMGERQMVDNVGMKDGQEGILSFAEKRKPVWSS